jgi:hypothetical protein
MNKEVPLKEIVTVSEMSRMCRLSRARFYQLINEGVFPTPSRNVQTKRPFFNREQQEQCLEIRRSNRGANGKAVMFYGCRPQAAPAHQPQRNRFLKQKQSDQKKTKDPLISEIRHGLFQLGVMSVSDTDIRHAVLRTYPDGCDGVKRADLLMAVFSDLNCRNSADKLSG